MMLRLLNNHHSPDYQHQFTLNAQVSRFYVVCFHFTEHSQINTKSKLPLIDCHTD